MSMILTNNSAPESQESLNLSHNSITFECDTTLESNSRKGLRDSLSGGNLIDFVEALDPAKTRGCYVCPVCGLPKLSIGKRGWNCYGCGSEGDKAKRKEIFTAVKQLAGAWSDKVDFDRGEYARNAERTRIAQERARAIELSKLPSIEVRHNEIEGQLSRNQLSAAHRQHLHDRGLNDLAIARFGFWTTENGIHGRGIAGVVRNGSGQAIGIAYRWDNASNGSPRYTFDKNYSRLQNGEVITSVWENPDGVADPRIFYLAEGLLFKPQAAALRLKGRVLGYGGGSGRIAQSRRSQILGAIEQFQPVEIRLLPDAGWAVNPGVRSAIKDLIGLIQSARPEIKVSLGYWGQTHDKAIGDIDDISPEAIEKIQWRDAADLFSKADPIAQLSKPKRTIDNAELQRSKGFRLLKNDLNRFQRRSKSLIDAVEQAQKTGQQQQAEIVPNHHATAIVPYEIPDWGDVALARLGKLLAAWEIGDHKKALRVLAQGFLPTPHENKYIGSRTCFPKWIDPLDYLAELKALGQDFIHDASECGDGKSKRAGEFGSKVAAGEVAGFDRAIYTTSAYRNPTVAELEHAAEMPTRHGGLVLDQTRKTPLGNPHRLRPKPGQTPDTEGNCIHHEAFATAAKRGVNLVGGVDSAICQTCEKFSNCEFLSERQRVLSDDVKFLRAHPAQLGKLKQGDIVFVDEAATELQPKTTNLSIEELRAEFTEVAAGEFKRPELLERFSQADLGLAIALADQLFTAIERVAKEDCGAYGLHHKRLLELMPNLIAQLPRPEFHHALKLAEATSPQLIRRGAVNPLDDFLKSITKAIAPKVQEIFNEILKQDPRIFSRGQTPADRVERVGRISRNGLGKLFGAITGNLPIDVGLSAGGQLEITQSQTKLRFTLRSAGLVVLLDATADSADLARSLGIKADNILTFRRKPSNYKNLTQTLYTGVGNCGRQRRNDSPFAQQVRITHLKQILNPDAVIDYQNYSSFFWFRDSRGTNAFKSCTHLVLTGLPTPNLKALAAEWHLATGQAVDPTDRTGGYGAFVRRRIGAEIIQGVGRLRAQWRPTEQLKISFLGDGFAPYLELLERSFPGSKVERLSVHKVCPEAEVKGLQTARKILNNIVQFAREGRGDISRDELAKVVRHSNPSKALQDQFGCGLRDLKKLVTFVLNEISATIFNTKVTASDESLKALLVKHFPSIYGDCQDPLDREIAIENLVGAILSSFGELAEVIDGLEPDCAALVIADLVAANRAEFGDELVGLAISRLPIGFFDPLLRFALGLTADLPRVVSVCH